MAYFSAYSREELARMARREALSVLGIENKGNIIQPAKCKKCGASLFSSDLREDCEFLQCSECNEIFEKHRFKNTMFKGAG